MGNKRFSSSLGDRRAVSLLQDALRKGSLRPQDPLGAAEILCRSVPHVRRMQRHAQEVFAGQTLRDALGALESSGTSLPDPRSQEPSSEAREPVSRGSSRPRSSDLLPALRTPKASAGRKRRRVVEPEASNAANDPSFIVRRPSVRLGDVGGVDSILASVRELVEWPLRHSELYAHLGVDPPRGILLHGPPGCGKTLLAHAIAGELDVPMLRVSAPEVVSGVSGDSERKLRDLFAEATRIAPSIIFIDEIDTIASRREDASKDMGRRIVAQLLTCLDELGDKESEPDGGVIEAERRDPERRDPERRDPDIESDTVRVGEAAVAEGEPAPEGMDGTDNTHHDEVTVGDPGVGSAPSGEQPKRPERDVGREQSGEVLESDSCSVSRGPVVVIAATNRPEVLEPALRRAGRFDREIELGAPDDAAREAILGKLCCRIRLADSCDFHVLAKKTAGYVGADLALLVKEAGVLSIRRFATARLIGRSSENSMVDVEVDCAHTSNSDSTILQATRHRLLAQREPFQQSELKNFAISMEDFVDALEKVQPSALREGFATRPNISWDDVGALEQVREDLIMAVVEPIRVPERFAALGLTSPAGVLLYGPPGCGKTLLARAVASESGANFISVKGPELLSKYVGDSELAVRKLFHRARASAPCIVFFDELDALAPRRGGSSGGGTESSSGASERVVNMLLTEMDGFDVRKQVFLIAATNRPDIIDPAMLRPGRLEKLLYVPLPTEEGRASILSTLLKKVSVCDNVDVNRIAKDPRCAGSSGADMSALVRSAGENAMRTSIARASSTRDSEPECIRLEDFLVALNRVLPSVSPRDARLYRSLESSLRKSRAHLAASAVVDLDAGAVDDRKSFS